MHRRLVLLLAGFAVPIFLTWLGYLPLAGTLGDRFIRPYLTYPGLIGTFQVQPLPFSLGNAPTWGRALFMFIMLVLNVVTTVAGYRTVASHIWLRNS